MWSEQIRKALLPDQINKQHPIRNCSAFHSYNTQIFQILMWKYIWLEKFDYFQRSSLLEYDI